MKGLNALLGIVSTAVSAPIIVAHRLREGPVSSARGAGKFLSDAIAAARRVGAGSVIRCRLDSAFYNHKFGYYAAGTAKQSAFPQVRILTLVECGTHASVWAEFDGVKTSDRVLTERMADTFTEDMIVLADRGFYSYELWRTATEGGAQLLWRISNTWNCPCSSTTPTVHSGRSCCRRR